jgi:hypothetical protein
MGVYSSVYYANSVTTVCAAGPRTVILGSTACARASQTSTICAQGESAGVLLTTVNYGSSAVAHGRNAVVFGSYMEDGARGGAIGQAASIISSHAYGAGSLTTHISASNKMATIIGGNVRGEGATMDATGVSSVIIGGYVDAGQSTLVSGESSVVLGGKHSTLTGRYSVIAGGSDMTLAQHNTLAAQNTIFGKTPATDSHQFTGSFSITGSSATFNGDPWLTDANIYISQSGQNVTLGDITAGTITATELHTTVESASIIFSSGSTIFGDTIDDTHHFTGSVYVSASNFEWNGNTVLTSVDSASLAGRITNNETDITNLQTDSGSFSTRVTTLENTDLQFILPAPTGSGHVVGSDGDMSYDSNYWYVKSASVWLRAPMAEF